MTSQFQIICKILETQDYSIISENNLDAKYFYEYEAQFNFIKNHYRAYKKVPDKLTFLEMFPDFDLIPSNEPSDYLLEQLIKDYKTSVMATSFNKIKKLIEGGKIAEAQQELVRSAEAVKAETGMKECVDLMKDRGRFERYLDRVNNPKNYYISTGLKELDAIIGGIDTENENMVIAARTGIGKTWTLLVMAAAAVKQGRNILFYSGEMTADKVGYRLDTLLGNIDNKVITRGLRDTDIELQYRKYIESLNSDKWGSFHVLTPNDVNGPVTVDVIQAEAIRVGAQEIFIDQYSLLEDARGAKVMHEKVANISKDIKNMQVKLRVPVISVSQMNRTKNEDGSQDSSQIGLSDRIGQDATVILMLSREGEMGDTLKINIVKSRDGGDGRKLTYRANFNTGMFCYVEEDGNGMNNEEANTEIINSYSTSSLNFNSGAF